METTTATKVTVDRSNAWHISGFYSAPMCMDSVINVFLNVGKVDGKWWVSAEAEDPTGRCGDYALIEDAGPYEDEDCALQAGRKMCQEWLSGNRDCFRVEVDELLIRKLMEKPMQRWHRWLDGKIGKFCTICGTARRMFSPIDVVLAGVGNCIVCADCHEKYFSKDLRSGARNWTPIESLPNGTPCAYRLNGDPCSECRHHCLWKHTILQEFGCDENDEPFYSDEWWVAVYDVTGYWAEEIQEKVERILEVVVYDNSKSTHIASYTASAEIFIAGYIGYCKGVVSDPEQERLQDIFEEESSCDAEKPDYTDYHDIEKLPIVNRVCDRGYSPVTVGRWMLPPLPGEDVLDDNRMSPMQWAVVSARDMLGID